MGLILGWGTKIPQTAPCGQQTRNDCDTTTTPSTKMVKMEQINSSKYWKATKASILLHSTFFMIQLSHPYKTPGKSIPMTRGTFVGKVMSLLFNMLSRFVIAFLPRSKWSFNFIAEVTICTDFGAPKFLELHGWRSLGGYSSWDCKRVRHDLVT